MINLDGWQKEVLEHKGNKVICSGRQTGKSTVVSMLAAKFALSHDKKHVLIVSVTEDQAKEMLDKIYDYIYTIFPKAIKKSKQHTNKEKITLTNGSLIRTKAVGQGGKGARGFTIDMLIADEAAFMPEDVWPAVTPMLLTTGGDIILISTPFGRQNYFYKCFKDPNFKVWHVNTIDAIGQREVCESWTQLQHDKALEYFESERYRLSEKQFQQEYEGLFVEDLNDFFPDEWLKKSLIQNKVDYGNPEGRDFYIGVDIGRLGGDRTVFVIGERRGELMIQREMIIWKEAYLDRIALQIIEWDKRYSFSRIFIDSGGIGVGVFDILYNTPGFRKRVKGINNSEKIVEYDQNGNEKRAKFMKEETYANLLFLMMKGKILLFDDSNIWLSLKSAQFEYINQRGGAMMKIEHIDHTQSHIAEAIVRLGMAMREKVYNPRITYF